MRTPLGGVSEVIEVDDIQQIVEGILDGGGVELLTGDVELCPDVSSHWVGRRRRGSCQAVRIRTVTGPIVLASDSCHFTRICPPAVLMPWQSLCPAYIEPSIDYVRWSTTSWLATFP